MNLSFVILNRAPHQIAASFLACLAMLSLTACGAKKAAPKASGIAAKVDSATSTITATTSILADGIATSKITILLLDSAGKPVAGVTPQFSVSGTGNTQSPCSLSDATGTSTCSFVTVIAESKAVAIVWPVDKTGDSVTFLAGSVAKVCVATEPASGVAGVAFSQQPIFKIGDINCNLISNATNAVTVTLSAGTGTLSGTTTVSAVAGVATFTNLKVDLIGTKEITASSSGLTSVVSSPFTVGATTTTTTTVPPTTTTTTTVPPTTTTTTTSTTSTTTTSTTTTIPDITPPDPVTIDTPTPLPYTSSTSSVAVSGGCEGGAIVHLTGDQTTDVACVANGYNLTLSKTVDGMFNYSIKQTDVAGNNSTSVNMTWFRDTLAPAPVNVTSPATLNYSSNSGTLAIVGTCENGSSVTITGDATSSATCASSTFNFSISKTTDATYNFSIQQRDSANNLSTSVNLVWALDAQPPAAPALTSPVPNPHNSNTNSIDISGSCEADTIINVTGDDTQSGSCSSGTFTVTVSKYTDGSYSFLVSQTDLGGNTSATNAVTWNRDTIAPAQAVLTAPASNPISTNGNSIAIAGSCEAGTSVIIGGDASSSTSCPAGSFATSVSKTSDGTYNITVTLKDTANNSSTPVAVQWVRDTVAPASPAITTPATNPYSFVGNSISLTGSCDTGNTVVLAGASSGSVACSGGAFSFTLNQTTDNTYDYTIKQVDSANNSSSTVAFSWIRDNLPPNTPVITTPSVASYISNNTTLTISGTCESGATVKMAGSSIANTTCLTSLFSFTITKVTNGAYSFNIHQTDNAGNDSGSATLGWTLDTVTPNQPVITSPAVSPYLSSNANLTISGDCEAISTVNLTGSATSAVTCSVLGHFNFSVTKSTDATYNFSVTQKDAANNTSTAATLAWTKDSSVPSTPVLAAPAVSPFYSNTGSITLTGFCDLTNTVTLAGDVVASDVTTPSNSLTTTCSSGSFTFIVAKSGGDVTYNFSIIQTSGASVDSGAATQIWVRDVTAPITPSLIAPAATPYTSSGTLLMNGSCEDGTTVNLTGADTQQLYCSGSAYDFSVVKGVDGTFNFSIVSVDAAGNSSATVSLSWIKDSTAIPAPAISSPSGNPLVNNINELTIIGSCEYGNTVNLSGFNALDITDPAGSSSIDCDAGSYSYTLLAPSDATYSISITQTNGLGTSPAATKTWTLDRVAPDTAISANPTDPNFSFTASFTFNSPDATATFECSIDSGAYATCTSPKSYTSMANGSHTFDVRGKDAAGNSDYTPAQYAWTQNAFYTIGLYHMNTGSELVNSSQYVSPYHSPLTNNATATYVAAKFGNGVKTSQASLQYLSTPDANIFDAMNSTMTIDLWIKFTSLPATTSANQVIISKDGLAGDRGWVVMLKRSSSSNYRLIFGATVTAGGTPTLVTSTSSCLADITTYRHIAVTWNAGSVTLFCDGASKGTGTIGTAGSAKINQTTAPLRIGRTETMSTYKYLDATIDEVRLSQKVRWTTNFTVPAVEYTNPD